LANGDVQNYPFSELLSTKMPERIFGVLSYGEPAFAPLALAALENYSQKAEK